MANKHLTLNELFTDIADKLRSKTNTIDTIIDDDFPDIINSIEVVNTAYSNSKATTIGDYAFYSCKFIKSADFPMCTSISDSAFGHCESLNSISFPICTTISSYAFNKCTSLTSVDFPECISIGSNAFLYCSFLTSISFPKCTSMDMWAFQRCYRLTSVNFPACTNVGGGAFAYCSSLTYVNLPACMYIHTTAFHSCKSLMKVILGNSSIVSLPYSNAFDSTPMVNSTYTGNFGSIYVPASLVASYKTAANWSYFADRITSIENLT